MRMNTTLQLVLAGFFVLIGLFGLLGIDSPGLFTGFFVYNGSTEELQFINPTPNDAATLNAEWLTINVSASSNVTHANIEWDGANESLTQDGNYWSIRKDSSGEFTYMAWFNMSNNGTLLTTPRTVKYGWIELSSMPDMDVEEDSSMAPIGLFQYVQAHDKESLDYNLTFDNNKLYCIINATYNITCTPNRNETGRTTIALKAADGPVSDTTSFTINITPVNDVPYAANTLHVLTVPEHKNASFTPGDYIKDVDGDILNFTPINNSIVQGYVKDHKIRLIPIQAGYETFQFIVTDGTVNVTYGIPVNVTVNHAPGVLNTITQLNWSENNVGSIRLTQLFYDPDGDALVYNISQQPAGMSARISAQSAFFVPEVGWTGTSVVAFTASDGAFTVHRSLTLMVGGVSSAAATEDAPDENAPVASMIDTVVFSPQVWTEEAEHSVDLSSFVATDAMDQNNLQVSVSGLSKIRSKLIGTTVTFIPDENFFGKEIAAIQITDGTHTYTGDMILTVINADDPLQLTSKLPSIELNENKTSMEIDLSKYFLDPDNEGLEFDIEVGDGVNVTFKSKSVVVFSMAGNAGSNSSATIIAKGSNGRSISSNMLVSLVHAAKSDYNWYKLFLQGLVVMILTGILTMGGMKYSRVRATRTKRLKHINNTIEQVYDDPELVRNLKSQALKHPKVKTPEEKVWVTMSKAASKLMNDLFYKLPQKQERPKEPKELRSELLFLKETISSLRAIATSTNDRLIAAALKAEKDKLMRAYHSIRTKPKPDRDSMRKLLLYVMEASSALQEISAVSDDTLISFEIRKQARRMKKVMNSLLYKLEADYQRDPFN